MARMYPVVWDASYNRVFRRDFQFVNLTQTRLKVNGASYNRVCLITEKGGDTSQLISCLSGAVQVTLHCRRHAIL